LIRGRLTIAGPITAAALGAPLGISVDEADAALLLLESDGVVLRGRFTPGERALEWCDRSLLARMHRYTLNRLRAEIEPVSPADFMRFLFRWQHVEVSSRLTGLDGLREVVAKLDGYETAAAAWERAVLPARVNRYDPSMLDMICLSGEAAWARLSAAPREGSDIPSLVPATPIALFLREHAASWRALRQADAEPPLSEDARHVLSTLRSRGASFFADLVPACDLDRDRLRAAIGTLVACGLVTSDGFSGLRALVWAARGRWGAHDRRSTFAGRWTALGPGTDDDRERAVEAQAWALLRRYGVMFRRLLTREANAAAWRELARAYRRLEARGEIRGGRFVTGMSGEQFALPDAIERLREVRRTAADEDILVISAADPLNLTGIATSGERVRAVARNRIAYRNGVPLAVREGDSVRELSALEQPIAADVARALKTRRAQVPA
jgi:ATP-dependent Lhr-like helicase